MARIESVEGEMDSPEPKVIVAKAGSSFTIQDVGVIISPGAHHTKVTITQDGPGLPLEKIVYGCWRGERTCAAWSSPDAPAKTYTITIDGKATTPVSITRQLWRKNNIILIGHKAGIAVTDAQLKPLEGYCFFSGNYNLDEGQFRSAAIIGNTLYAAHFHPDAERVFPMNGIYSARFKKGETLTKIIDRKAGPLFKFKKKPYLIQGPNLYRLDKGKPELAFHEPDNALITAGYANSTTILLGTKDGYGHVLGPSHYQGNLIPFSPKVTCLAKVMHKGRPFIIAGSDQGNLVVRDFELKEAKPIVTHNLGTYSKGNTAIRKIVVPKEEEGIFYMALSDLILEISLDDLLTRGQDQLSFRAKAWKGASSSIYSMDVLVK